MAEKETQSIAEALDEFVIDAAEGYNNADIDTVSTVDTVPEANDDAISLHEVLSICRTYVEDPSNEDSIEKYKELLKRIKVVKYLPLELKAMIVDFHMKLNPTLKELDSSILSIITPELNRLFYMLFAYTNINTEGFTNLLTVENYDILQRTIGEAIEISIAIDYARLNRMITEYNATNNTRILLEGINSVDEESMAAQHKQMQKTLKLLRDNEDILNLFTQVQDKL